MLTKLGRTRLDCRDGTDLRWGGSARVVSDASVHIAACSSHAGDYDSTVEFNVFG